MKTPFYHSLRETPFSARRKQNYISLETAKQTVLSHAKTNPADIDEIRVSHIIKLEKVLYSFTIKKGSETMLYQINAVTGEIISHHIRND